MTRDTTGWCKTDQSAYRDGLGAGRRAKDGIFCPSVGLPRELTFEAAKSAHHRARCLYRAYYGDAWLMGYCDAAGIAYSSGKVRRNSSGRVIRGVLGGK